MPFDAKKFFVFILLLLVISWYSLFLFQRIDLTREDVGRHIKNGQLLLSGEKDVLYRNFYSYTNPSFAFINHHWGSGVVFYIIYNFFGFKGLHLFFIFLSLLVVFLVILLSRKFVNIKVIILSLFFVIPFFLLRREVRPEIFSYLFSLFFFLLLTLYQRNNLNKKWLFILPIIQFIWVNLHLYFFIGIFLILAFILENLIAGNKNKTKKLFYVFLFSSIFLLVNPTFLKGVFYPFQIFSNYGYKVLENQPLWFMANRFGLRLEIILFIVFSLISLMLFYWLIKNRKIKKPCAISFLIIFIFIFLSALFIYRNLYLFGIFILPILFFLIKNYKSNAFLENLTMVEFSVSFLFLFVLSTISLSKYSPLYSHSFGLGLMKENLKSINFIKENKIKGRMFNNYDVGSYIIFSLYPKNKIFVDNRPEAYPANFFKKEYIPMQENKEIWLKEVKKWNFNVIIFSYYDLTPWGQKFLIDRVKDRKNWIPVYVDNYVLIFLKNNKTNKAIINKYSLPKNLFEIRKK